MYILKKFDASINCGNVKKLLGYNLEIQITNFRVCMYIHGVYRELARVSRMKAIYYFLANESFINFLNSAEVCFTSNFTSNERGKLREL